ncbi:hypothetical protein [Pseudomonas halotolerans]|uniref:hypothetical protein n=1 Tax=Pseudomonas halotolerans TaxID=3143552 RepID=UPI0031CEB65A
MNEIISQLVGALKFSVDSSGLQRFTQMMKTAESQMTRLGKQATQLQTKLNKSLNIGNKSSSKLKLDADVRRSLDKELALETKLTKLRRQQFSTELAQQKLVYAGAKQEASLQSAALKDQIQRAVVAAKQQKVQQEALKTRLGEAKLTAAAEQSQLRQTRLADILQKRQARTVQLQQQALLAQNKFQRAEVALNNARAAGIRQAERWATTKTTTANREARATERHQQQAQRFQFAAQRHEAWQARQTMPKPMDFSGLAIGVTGATAALYGLVRGVSYLSERVTQRQSEASGAEAFDTSLQAAGGKNPDNQKFARDQFIDISNKYGQEVSVETARSFALFVQGQLALGKTLTQATKIFENQSATWRAASLDKESQKRANYQISQIRAKGRPEGSDVNDLFDAVGGVVAASIRQAAATRLGFKGKVEEQAGWFKQAVTDAKITAADFDQGMSNFLKANQDILAKQMNSIAAAQQRSDNQAYLNDNIINASEELKGVILERIESERQLNEAMKPFKETLALFDIGLTKLATQMLRFGANRNVDGSEKTSDQQVQDKMSTVDIAVDTRMTGTGNYDAIDGSTQRQGGPIGGFWNWLFDVKDYRKGEANELQALEPNTVAMQFPKLDLSKFVLEPENFADGRYRQFRMPEPVTAKDIMDDTAQQQRRQTLLPSDWLLPTDLNAGKIAAPSEHINSSTHASESAVIVNVTVEGGRLDDTALANKIGDVVGVEVDAQLSKMLIKARGNQQEVY